MKVVDKKEFLKLPDGTFFCKGCQWVFDDLCIKMQSLEGDFCYHNLCIMDSNSSDQYFYRLSESFKNDISYPMNDSWSRDGMFCDEDLFLIYEKEDLYRLRELINYFLKEK